MGGAIAGLCGGLAMTLVGLALGIRSATPLATLVVVAVLATAWGVLFAHLFAGFSPAATVGGGLMWGFVVWLIMWGLVLPLAGARLKVPIDRAVAVHLVYGIVVGIAYLPFQKPAGRPLGPAEEPL